MKKCIRCGREIRDDAKFCTKCGARQTEERAAVFCPHCGRKLPYDAIYCAYCGRPLEAGTAQRLPFFSTFSASANRAAGNLAVVSEREKLYAIFWVAVAILQVIIGCGIIPFFIVTGLIYLGVAALNFWSAYQSFIFARRILFDPTGIIGRYEKITPFAVTLAYNLLIFILGIIEGGGAFLIVVGLLATAVSILDILLRSFVLQNRAEFEQLENAHSAGQDSP